MTDNNTKHIISDRTTPDKGSDEKERDKDENKDYNPETGEVDDFRQKILAWYDSHKRELPWRQRKYSTPYHIWLSEVMLQQTVVNTVIPYFLDFVRRWPTVHDLAAADRDDILKRWAGLGYYARARNLHKTAVIVSRELGGEFPNDIKSLKALPGIGEYTSAAIRSIAFDKPAVVVDGNIERVMARYKCVEQPLPSAKKKLKTLAGSFAEGRADRPGDYAQALMDLGATICIAKTPRCAKCPVNKTCAGYKNDIAETLPRRIRKTKDKPFKKGYAYIIRNEFNEILYEKRINDTILKDMMGLPTSDWVRKSKPLPPHLDLVKTLMNGDRYDLEKFASVYHSFTHFDLRLDCYYANVRKEDISMKECDHDHYKWLSLNYEDIGLPSLFDKVRKSFVNNQN